MKGTKRDKYGEREVVFVVINLCVQTKLRHFSVSFQQM